MAAEIPATAEVILKTDAGKQFLNTLPGQGWDAWGEGLGGSQAAELMLQWKYSGNRFRSGGEYKFLFNGYAGTITEEKELLRLNAGIQPERFRK
jgi:hypothetical protein